MQTVHLELYRILIFEGLYKLKDERQKIIHDVIHELISVESHGFTWTLGNITSLDEGGLYFRIGRRSGVNLIEYNQISSTFDDTVKENWPFAHIFCDTQLSLVAISRSYNLTGDTSTTAHRIEDIFKNSRAVLDNFANVSLKPIDSANDFMKELEGAFSIKRFYFQIARPNPFDAEELIQKPLENFVKAADAYKGEVELEGANLNASVIEDTARSAIASGNEVGAVIKRERRSKPEPINSKSYPEVIRNVDFDPSDNESLSRALRRIRSHYSEIRRREVSADGKNRSN